jgi:predicted DNA-binding transcriptional regulator AlpA
MSEQPLEKLLDEKQLAGLLGVSTGTLRYWRVHRLGPPYRKVGSQLVRYSPSDVQTWLSTRKVDGKIAPAGVAQ